MALLPCPCIECCLNGALSQKCLYISACTKYLQVSVYKSMPASVLCMHNTSLLLVMCSSPVFRFCANVSCCSSSADPSFCLSVPLCCSCCTALNMLLCYLCLQLVFGRHHTVFCPDSRCPCVQPSPSTCVHCPEFTFCLFTVNGR